MEKLELKNLAPYLPYGLKMCSKQGTIFYLNTFSNMKGRGIESRDVYSCLDNQYKPILRPLSDLTKDELKNAEFDYQIDWLTHERDSHVKFYGSLEKFINKTDFGHVQYLISKHYDVFGLIEKGLAIDINTLPHD